MGAVKLAELHPHMIQGFINGLELAPSSARLVYQVLHRALEKAVDLDYIPRNPSDRCELPRMERKEIHPLDDQQAAALLKAAKGTSLEHMVAVALFTGMRQSEILGLTWDAVDFATGSISVNKQLSRLEHRNSGLLVSPKSGKGRTITAAPLVLRVLQAQRRRQAEMQLKAGPAWSNPHGLVFTNEIGLPMEQRNVDYQFKRIAAAAGLPGVRFHDTRHPNVKPRTKDFYPLFLNKQSSGRAHRRTPLPGWPLCEIPR